MIVATNESQSRRLDRHLQLARANRVPDVRKIGPDEIKRLEPNVSAHSALLVPTSGIIDPTALLHQVYASASNRGAHFMPATQVIDLDLSSGQIMVTIRYRDGKEDRIAADTVINAAGVHAVDVARLIDPQIPIRAAFIRGDSYKFYRNRRSEIFLRGMNVYPTPITIDTPSGQHHTVGVHLTPTFDRVDGQMTIGDTVTVGPKLIPIAHLEDHATPVPEPEAFLEKMGYFPYLSVTDLEFHQSGIQARLDGYHDFYIKPDRSSSRVIHLLGIDSPGLTAAPAIAKYIVNLLRSDCG